MNTNIKRFFAASVFALAAVPAMAFNIATSPTTNGGQIVMTNDQRWCAAGTKYIFATSAGGRVIAEGCWSYDDPVVVAQYTDGSRFNYNTNSFLLTDAAKRDSAARNK